MTFMMATTELVSHINKQDLAMMFTSPLSAKTEDSTPSPQACLERLAAALSHLAAKTGDASKPLAIWRQVRQRKARIADRRIHFVHSPIEGIRYRPQIPKYAMDFITVPGCGDCSFPHYKVIPDQPDIPHPGLDIDPSNFDEGIPIQTKLRPSGSETPLFGQEPTTHPAAHLTWVLENMRLPSSDPDISSSPSGMSSRDKPKTIKTSPFPLLTAVPKRRRADVDQLIAKFFIKETPDISIPDYLQRIQHYCPMTSSVYLAASTYLRHLVVTPRDAISTPVPVTPRTVHRLVLAAIVVAMKAVEGWRRSPGRLALAGGVSKETLLDLVMTFCQLMEFRLTVCPEMLDEAWDMLNMRPERWCSVHGSQE